MINIEDQKEDEYYSGDRPELQGFIPKEAKKILDVGCGIGLFAKSIKERNAAEVWGLEYDTRIAKKAQEVLDKVLTGDILTLVKELPDNYFDVISFNDVLEHLIDPYQVLELMSKKLNEGGMVFSSIPNVRYFKSMLELIVKKDLEYTDYGIFDRTHLRFFTKKSIIRMFENAGYDVVQIKGINPTKSIRPFLIKLLSFGYLDDGQFLQYAVVARPKSK